MDYLWQFALIRACRGVGELPAAVLLAETEGELQAPGVLAATVNGCQHTTAACEGGAVAVDGDVELLGLATVVVQSAVSNSLQILLAVLPCAGHMHKVEVVGEHRPQGGGVFLDHRAVHPLVERSYLSLVVHGVNV